MAKDKGKDESKSGKGPYSGMNVDNTPGLRATTRWQSQPGRAPRTQGER
jgi:hypothetical protein